MITREGLYTSSNALGEMGDAVEAFLVSKGYEQQQSYHVSNDVIAGISDSFGGCNLYMPKNFDNATKAIRLLNEVAATIEDVLDTFPFLSVQARKLSTEITEYLRKLFMGNNFYITNRATRNFHDRNAQILSDFYRGVSHRELSKKYGHSVQWIYKIIADERKKEKEQRVMQQGQI